MKKRIVALLLLLALILTACASEAGLSRDGKESENVHSFPDRREEGNTVPDVDMGAADGNTYRNMVLGLSASFPEDWTVCDDAQLAAWNGLDEATFDRAAVLDAINAGQDVTVFSAGQSFDGPSVVISASKNPLPGKDADALVNHFSPLVKDRFDQSASMELISCDSLDVDFCGEDHVALAVCFDKVGLETVYEKILYLPVGDLLYTLTVTTGAEDTTDALLSYFEALD
ncbi:MAG: hypothetical protein IJG45_07460 [Oscillospiraceae bacterium]|nr:hypothetical protein [Oscillospiraceae bacterium]